MSVKGDPRIKPGGQTARGGKEIGLMLMDLAEDIAAGRVDAVTAAFSPSKHAGKLPHKTWVLTIKGHGSGVPVVVDQPVEEEFSGQLF